MRTTEKISQLARFSCRTKLALLKIYHLIWLIQRRQLLAIAAVAAGVERLVFIIAVQIEPIIRTLEPNNCRVSFLLSWWSLALRSTYDEIKLVRVVGSSIH